jgi:glycosyltransferase involved in cell wall biosynthesis
MNIEILVSTMNQKDMSLPKKMNLTTDAIIINQSDRVEREEIIINNHKIRMHSNKERGLSKSRNRAVENAIGDICLIADDDVTYYDNIEKQITNIVEKNPETSVFIFNLDKHRPKKLKSFQLNFLDILKVSSVQIAFKRKAVVDNNIRFLENFGTGSGKVLSGEENIFLNECLKKKLKICYYPVTIGYMNDSPSSWFSGQNEKYFCDKGAVFYELSPFLWKYMAIAFAAKKYNSYKNEITFKNALKSILIGGEKYKVEKTHSTIHQK